MKNYTTVNVEAEISASHIKRFTQRIPSHCSCPMSQAIANVREILRKEGHKHVCTIGFRAN